MSVLAYDFDRQGNLVPLCSDPQAAPLSQQRRDERPSPAELRLDRSRDGKLTAFGKATLKDRYLLPGEGIQDMFGPRRLRLRRRPAACPTSVRRHVDAVVHAGDADPLQWRNLPGPAHFLLPQCRARQPGRHRRDQERNLLTQIFRFFTQSDVEVSDNYLKRYMPIFQPLEIQMMMAAFTNMETIHIDAYALLLKTLGMPQTEFAAFRDYAAMRGKADYMHSFGVDTVADVSRTLAMFGAFTEGMALFASFAMLLNFPRHNKMKGMGQIVTWSVRDESLHCDGIVQLFHEWNRETGALTRAVRDDILDVAKTMVGLEEKFVDLAFELGEVEGMRPEDIRAYVRYVADWRLTQLRLPVLYGHFKATETGYEQIRPHPLPWLVEILNGVEHANFFEQRATEYSKAASHGSWDGPDGVWAIFDRRQNPEAPGLNP